MRSIIEQGPKVLENPKDYAARAEIMLAGTVAHNNSLDMGRETDWASHDIEHELSGIYDLAHGAGLSIVFPAWMKYVYKVNKPRFEQFAYRVFGIEPQFDGSDASIIKGIKALENFYVSMGLPIRLEDADIRDDRYEEMAKKATNNDTRTLGHFKPLDSKDIHEIYKLCAMSKKW
jgi:alcohol dehydrogenase YqhD (iron-dependent ADH family)